MAEEKITVKDAESERVGRSESDPSASEERLGCVAPLERRNEPFKVGQEFVVGGKIYKIIRRFKTRTPSSISRANRQARDPQYAARLKEQKAAWNKARTTRAKEYGKRQESRRSSRLQKIFVAIDSEGRNVGEPFARSVPDGVKANTIRNASRYQDQRAVLWGAGDATGVTQWLHHPDETPLSGLEICGWLCSLPKKFKDAIFISFGFSYDATQILRDMPEPQPRQQKGRALSLLCLAGAAAKPKGRGRNSQSDLGARCRGACRQGG